MKTSFDWLEFFDTNNIDYVTSGANVARGNVNIQCPFCYDDPSHHLGVALSGAGWGCWRDTTHRGISPIKLIQKLLDCSYNDARAIAGIDRLTANVSDTVQSLLGEPPINRRQLTIAKRPSLEMPSCFQRITNQGAGRQFWQYLHQQRGFEKRDVDKVIEKYDLRYCIIGQWRYRVIFPLYFNNQLVCWTGRSVLANESVRYLTLSSNAERADSRNEPVALKNTGDILYNYDELKKREKYKKDLYVVEGPFDAIKIDYYGERLGVRATCLFTSNITEAQKALLQQLSAGWDLYVLMDDGAYTNASRIADELTWLHPVLKVLPDHVKDPGEMSVKDVQNLK